VRALRLIYADGQGASWRAAAALTPFDIVDASWLPVCLPRTPANLPRPTLCGHRERERAIPSPFLVGHVPSELTKMLSHLTLARPGYSRVVMEWHLLEDAGPRHTRARARRHLGRANANLVQVTREAPHWPKDLSSSDSPSPLVVSEIGPSG
jgi:hypothetical protein